MVMSATRAELSQKLSNLGFIIGTRVQGLCLSWCPRPQPPKDLSEKVPQQHPQIPQNKAQLTAKALGSPSRQEGIAKCWGGGVETPPKTPVPASSWTPHKPQLLRAVYIPSLPTQSPWSLAPAQTGPRQGRAGQMVGRREAESVRDSQKQNHTIKQKQIDKAETLKVCVRWLVLCQLNASYSHLRKDR